MKIIRSFRYAFNGIRYCFLTQPNYRIHIGMSLAAIGMGCLLKITSAEWLLVVFSIVLVLATEMFNTAIEKICDLVHPDHHPEIKIIKDVSAGAVLFSALASLIAGGVIFIPKFLQLIR